MNLNEFTRVTATKLNETLASKFGTKLNIASFTTEQLLDARNKIRTKLFNTETTESFDAVQKADYTKNKLFLDVLNAAISERDDNIVDAIDEAVQVNEGAEDEAELVMAAKDMVDRVTGWMEDTAEMQTESMLELADAIRDELGAEQAEGFTNTIKPALDSLYSAMEGARVSLTTGVGMLTGEGDADMLGNDDGEMGDMDMDMEPTTDMDDGGDLEAELGGDDEFGAADAAAGGEEPEERAKRESVDPRKLAGILSKNIKEAAGKMPSKAAVMKCCKEGMSKADCCKKYPNCDQTKLKEMYESCMSEMKDSKKK